MDGKKNVKNRAEAFFGGKGFYIVLFVCLAVIGVSAWAMLFSGSGEADNDIGTINDASISVMAGQDNNAVSDVPVVKDDGAVKPNVPTQPDKTDTKKDEVKQDSAKPPVQDTPTAEDAEENRDSTVGVEDLSFMWPVSGSISKEYSPDSLIYNKTMADWRTHDGVDIAAQIGTRVFAAADGKVSKVYEDDLYGTTVIIDHGNGLASVYSNMAATPTVKEGDAVTMGSVIGSVGDTALGETGEVAHLHFEMTMEEASVDPAEYLPKR